MARTRASRRDAPRTPQATHGGADADAEADAGGRGGNDEQIGSGRSGVIHEIAGWIIPDASPAGAVYGVITVGALLAAEGGLHDTYGEIIASVVIAMSLYGFAHGYSELLGRRLAAHTRPGRTTYVAALLQGVAVLEGASLPLLTLLIAWAVGAPLSAAVTAAIWTAVASLIALELAAGVLARAGTFELAVDAAVGVAMGLGIVALKIVLA
jgi:hypothetical protein